MTATSLANRIDALLPQTQCGKCGYPGCRPYAKAMAAGEAINKCPPGGEQTLADLAALLQRPLLPLAEPAIAPQLAVIREADCIGCTKCIQVCPTDAIIGAAKHMHSVLNADCTGCALCLPACPVDCIDLITLGAEQARQQRARAPEFRRRHQRRQTRLQRLQQQHRPRQPTPPPTTPVLPPADPAAAASAKQIKLELARLRMALNRVQQQLQRHGEDARLLAQRQQLERACQAQQQQLEQLEGTGLSPTTGQP